MFNFKVLCIVGCLAVAALAAKSVGSATELTGADKTKAIQSLEGWIQKLAAGDGPTLTLSKVTKVTKQVVAGELYKYDVVIVENGKTEACQAELWARDWLDSYQLTITCPDEDRNRIIFHKFEEEDDW